MPELSGSARVPDPQSGQPLEEEGNVDDLDIRAYCSSGLYPLDQPDAELLSLEWAERFFNVQRWTEMAHGGHFAALEEPEWLAEDIRTWFRIFRHPRSR